MRMERGFAVSKSKVRESLKKAARKHGVSEHEIEREIKEAICTAFHHPDPEIQARFRALFPAGMPEPESFLEPIARLVRQK